ncbi:MAG: hypothetical protein ACPLPS_06850, partial [bacterium]
TPPLQRRGIIFWIPRLATLGTPFSKRGIWGWIPASSPFNSPFIERGVGFAEGDIFFIASESKELLKRLEDLEDFELLGKREKTSQFGLL